jgi:hypothetical protein
MKKISVKYVMCVVLFLLSLSLLAGSAHESPINFVISAKGSIEDWLEFEPSENLTMSRNSMKRIAVIVKPPENVANGVYTGSIVVSTTPAQNGEGGVGVGVTTGTTSDVSVRIVGDEIKKARVESVNVKDTEEGHPVEFSVSILNEGNVIIYPLIDIEITKNGESEVLKSAKHSETEILPTKMRIIRVTMDTEGLEIGEYQADVKVFLDEEKLSEKTLSFNLFERGTLSKIGILQKIWNEPWVSAGDLVKIDAYFENAGELLVTGKFKGEIHTAGRIVEIVESEELEVPVGKTVVMSAYFRPGLPGQYVVKGNVIYGGKTTETKESFINVNPGGEGTGAQPDYSLLAVAIVAVLVIIFLLRRRLGRGKR